MYEVGYAHGRGLEPLIFTLNPELVDRLPGYLRSLNVHRVSEDGLPNLIHDHLHEVKRRHDLPNPTQTAG